MAHQAPTVYPYLDGRAMLEGEGPDPPGDRTTRLSCDAGTGWGIKQGSGPQGPLCRESQLEDGSV